MNTHDVGGLDSRFVKAISENIACSLQQVMAAAELLAGGATVPFIARYRKEVTGGLDDAALEKLAKQRPRSSSLTQARSSH